ncbi:GATA zinc finger domain-containing protein [Ditylenchus destructor]|nr:GATA zinc finger domain-containing protein [Ditylenchus destructor]
MHFGLKERGQNVRGRAILASLTRLPIDNRNSSMGKCKVKVVKDIRFACSPVSSSLCLSSSVASPNSTAAITATVAESAAVKGPGNLELLKEADSFFTCLNYNQDSSRLAAVQGEIRVGGSFQAKLPPCASSSISDEPDRDELLYRPGYICQETEQNYVKVVRAFRTFSLMNNKKITQLEKSARSGDLLFDDAVVNLHRCGYNVVEATKMMQELDQHLTSDSSFMSAEDVKKFGKGIKTYGKNFIKISKELVPLHQRDQLVGFYYLWKKSREATRPKPLRKNNMASVGRRSNKPNNFSGNGNGTGGGMPRNASSKSVLTALSTTDMEFVDYASASETEAEQVEERACHHCYSSKSKDWHHAGRDRQLMCTECRLFYKKYGQLRPVDRPATVPPCLFKSARQSPTNYENEENDEPALGVRTRGAGRKDGRRGRTPTSMPLDGYGLEMKTPIKSELLENGAVFERRTTPQRTAKSNRKRPRASASGGDEITPTSKGKRAKVESRTPSPLTTADGLPSSGNEAENSKRSAKASSMSSTSSSCSGDNSLDDQIKREIVESMATTSGIEDVNMPNGVSSGEQSSGQTGKPTPKSAELGSKRPIAKVEPLDPNESAKRRNSPATQATTDMFNGGTTPQRKSGVVGTATKMLKFEHKKEVAEVKEEKCEQKPSTSTPMELDNKSLLGVDGDDEQSNETADASAIGESVDSAIPTSLVLKDEEEKKKDRHGTTLEEYPNLRRHVKRSSGVTCARTDIAYIDSVTSEWQMKRAEVAKKREQQLLEQQQRDTSAAAAAAAASLSLAAANQHQQQQAQAQSHQHNMQKAHGAMVGMIPQHSQQMVRKPDLPNHVDGMPPGSTPNTNMPMDINQALLMGAGRVPLNGVPVSAAAGIGPGGMPLPPPPGWPHSLVHSS